MSTIAVHKLVRDYGTTRAVDHVDIAAAEGEFIALLGPSGCGKSTLLRLIAGLDRPDAGHIEIDGQDVSGVPAARRNIAMVFQNFALYPHLTVAENLATPLRLRLLRPWQRLPLIWRLLPAARAMRRTIEERVKLTAEHLAIGPLLHRKPAQLSGGQRQRVALGRAIVREPSVFLFDEPLSNLDAALRSSMRAEIVELHRRLGVASIYVTHDQVEAMTMADRIAVMQAGRILQIGTPSALYNDPASIEVARAIGVPPIALIDANIDAGQLRIGSHLLPLRVEQPDGGRVRVGIRAEHVELSSHGALSGTVAHVENLGPELLIHLAMPPDWIGDRLIARQRADRRVPRRGDAMPVRFALDRLLVFDAMGKRLRTTPPAGLDRTTSERRPHYA